VLGHGQKLRKPPARLKPSSSDINACAVLSLKGI
jgi:hypothetical protein